MCGSTQKAIVEKMIDVSLATDMVRFACKGKYDLAFLVTQDRDFIPAIMAVKSEGKMVAHAFLERTAITSYCTKDTFIDISSIFRPT